MPTNSGSGSWSPYPGKAQKFLNNYSTKLGSDIITSSTTILLQDAVPVNSDGTSFIILTIEDGLGNIEIIASDQWVGSQLENCQRGLEGTTAQAFTSGALVEMRLTADRLDTMMNYSADALLTDLDGKLMLDSDGKPLTQPI